LPAYEHKFLHKQDINRIQISSLCLV